MDCGDFVIVINSDKAVLTGKKLDDKFYRYHTGYIGGLKEIPYRKMMAEKSDLAVYEAVKGMLPKNSLGAAMLKKVRVYKGAEHEQQAQQPQSRRKRKPSAPQRTNERPQGISRAEGSRSWLSSSQWRSS